LSSGDAINAGSSGNNLLVLQGAGTFDLRAPATLTNVQTADVTGASAGQTQLIDLRNGLDLTLNVQDSAAITLIGATNNDIVNLGSGTALVTLAGAGEAFTGGTGNDTFLATAATVGATVTGGSGTNALDLQGGGTIAIGSNITNVPQIALDNAAAYNLTLNANSGLTVTAGAGNDTITPGAASQTILGSTGTLTVVATAALASVAIDGTSNSTTTLQITSGGTVALNSADNNLTVQLAAGDTMALSANTSIAVAGGGGNDTLIDTDGILRAGQTIAPGGANNTLLFATSGTFDLRAPTILSNIQTVDLENATAVQGRTVYLRNGLNLTLNDMDAAVTTIFGAANNDIINLGSGTAAVVLGSAGETVNGGSGNDTYYVTATTVGATIKGGTGSNALDVQGGGTATMGTNISGVQTVFLDNAPTYDFTANATPWMVIFANTGNDTIAVGAATQGVVASIGTLTIQATAAEAGAGIYNTGGGNTTLEITSGGTATLNSNDSTLTVKLDASTNLALDKLGFITAIGAAAGNDTITAGGAKQTLESTGGNDTLVGSTAFGDTFLGTSAGLAGDTISGFGGSDAIDITDMVSSNVQPYVFNAATNQLSLTDGTHSLTLTFAGSYTAASFTAPVSDGHTGTLIKFV
jgi:hypothetical protein